MKVVIKVAGLIAAQKALTAMLARSIDHDRRSAYAAKSLLKSVQDNYGENQPRVRGWPRGYRAGQRPFKDTGELYSSIVKGSSGRVAIVGTSHVRGTLDNDKARTVTPKGKKWLAIPLSPPLSAGEARAYNNARVPGGFVITRSKKSGYQSSKRKLKNAKPTGYEGPGVYRKKGNLIERVKAFVKSVRMPARTFMKPTADWISAIGDKWAEWTATGKGL